jgi:hypothetical protein
MKKFFSPNGPWFTPFRIPSPPARHFPGEAEQAVRVVRRPAAGKSAAAPYAPYWRTSPDQPAKAARPVVVLRQRRRDGKGQGYRRFRGSAS